MTSFNLSRDQMTSLNLSGNHTFGFGEEDPDGGLTRSGRGYSIKNNRKFGQTLNVNCNC